MGTPLYKIKERKSSGTPENSIGSPQPAVRKRSPAGQHGQGWARGTPSPPAVPGGALAGCLAEASRGHGKEETCADLGRQGLRPKVPRCAAGLALSRGTSWTCRVGRGGGSDQRLARKEVTVVSLRKPDQSSPRHRVPPLRFHQPTLRTTRMLRDKAPLQRRSRLWTVANFLPN